MIFLPMSRCYRSRAMPRDAIHAGHALHAPARPTVSDDERHARVAEVF